jgi:hypothetical protein
MLLASLWISAASLNLPLYCSLALLYRSSCSDSGTSGISGSSLPRLSNFTLLRCQLRLRVLLTLPAANRAAKPTAAAAGLEGLYGL